MLIHLKKMGFFFKIHIGEYDHDHFFLFLDFLYVDDDER
jgi:hypothetical protein